MFCNLVSELAGVLNLSVLVEWKRIRLIAFRFLNLTVQDATLRTSKLPHMEREQNEAECHDTVVMSTSHRTHGLTNFVAFEVLHLLNKPRGIDIHPAVTEHFDEQVHHHGAGP